LENTQVPCWTGIDAANTLKHKQQTALFLNYDPYSLKNE
jgi:hypothetical protein